MSGPSEIVILDWRPLARNTLKGFARIKIVEWKLIVNDVAVHERDGRKWAALPSRPMLDSNRRLMLDETGKPKYSRVLEFTEREIADRFSDAVVAAVDRFADALARAGSGAL
jgi:hypothetical protein